MRLIIYSMPVFAVVSILASRTVLLIETDSTNSTLPPPPEATAILKATERRYFMRTGRQMIISKQGSQTATKVRCGHEPEL